MKFIALCLILFYYISHSIMFYYISHSYCFIIFHIAYCFSSIIISHSIATDLLYYIARYTVVYFAFIDFMVLYEVFFHTVALIKNLTFVNVLRSYYG